MADSSRPRGRVIVVGSSNTDLVVHCARLPRPGETILGKDLLTCAGGKGANQAVAAARAGAKVHFVGAFGDDAFGRARRADLEREGIDCSGCVVKKGVPSGVALIAVGAEAGGRRQSAGGSRQTAEGKAENLIVVAPGANARLTPEDVRRGMPKLSNKDVVVCSLEVPAISVRKAFDLAWDGMACRMLNPAPFPSRGWPKNWRFCCDLMTPNETEFEMLFGAEADSRQARTRLWSLCEWRRTNDFPMRLW